MPKNFDLKGPAFVGIQVRDVKASADFYEKTLGFRRDPANFPNGAVAFLTYPIPFGLTQLPPGVGWDSILRPVETPSIWFKAADSQAIYDSLVEEGVTILRAPSDGRFGRQFTFVDLDNYAITIYDRDAPAEGWNHAGELEEYCDESEERAQQ
jgi:catechol 2,3-dioxygenase-like lactoylglutathione lyase family enzyme